MALSPDRPLSPAYARRIARALAQGKTLQQARGHKLREHIERRARETALGGLTTSQKASIRKYLKEQAHKGGVTALQDLPAKNKEWQSYYEIFQKNGYDLLNKMKAFQKASYKGSDKKSKKLYNSIDAMLEDFGHYEGIEAWMLFYGSR